MRDRAGGSYCRLNCQQEPQIRAPGQILRIPSKKARRRYFVETRAKLRRTGTGQTYNIIISGGIHSPAEVNARPGGRLLLETTGK